MQIDPLLQTDFYKVGHYAMYPPGTQKVYSNVTPRKSRLKDVNEVVVFGFQYWILEYLIKQWNDGFFRPSWLNQFIGPHHRTDVILRYTRMVNNTLGPNAVTTKHIEALWDKGYLPLHIKALPEGTLCPIGVPMATITNTDKDDPYPSYWLVNYLETIMSCTTWQMITSATIAHEYKKLLILAAQETGGPREFVQWQAHDFSMRGLSSLESACTSGAGHLLSFTGTDTIPAISFLERYYGANVEKELVGGSVPATEHSVMCMGQQSGELETFRHLLNQYPSGILSVVSDTWDLWRVCTEYVATLKSDILSREGKLVIRPDSGDPVDILCGIPKDRIIATTRDGGQFHIVDSGKKITDAERKGVVELLWETFGGTINEKGFKQLDSHIGVIYGDSITLERARAITDRLAAKGFASTNVVLGVGSYTYQYNTRDTFGLAVKATYGEVRTQKMSGVSVDCREIFKNPITDDGTKKSAKGLLLVRRGEDGKLRLFDQVSPQEEAEGELKTVFLDGELKNFQTLAEIRERLASQVKT